MFFIALNTNIGYVYIHNLRYINKTKFIPFDKNYYLENYNFPERFYCIQNNITSVKTCVCGKKLPFINFVKGYAKYCRECGKKSCAKNKIKTIENKILKKLEERNISLIDEYEGSLYLKKNNYKFKCNNCGKEFEHHLFYGSGTRIKCECEVISKSVLEDSLEKFLVDNNIIFIKNDRKVLDGLELDFLLPEYNVAIECNGLYWHSEDNGKDKFYHLNKTVNALNKNIEVLHFFEDELRNKFDIIKSMILSRVSKSTHKIYARKCKIQEITSIQKNQFLKENHLQGEDKSKIKLGLFKDEQLVSVMTFGKPRYNKNFEYELIRFCNKKNCNVIGGASKLFKYFINTYKPENIITYADRRYSNGNLYKKLNMEFLHYSKPNYFYITKRGREHRSNYQKHNLKTKLELFDENLTEYENMKLNNYSRIWDCGNLVFYL